jgi:hypothetical protein
MGGYCPEAGIVWQVKWPDHIAALFHEQQPALSTAELEAALEDPEMCPHNSALFINELELLAMVINAWLVLQDQRLVQLLRDTESALALFGDNTAAVSWLRKAGCTRRIHTAGELVRFMGSLEISSGVCFSTKHVKGVENVIADFVSRGFIGDPQHPAHGSAPDLSNLTLVQVPSLLLEQLYAMLVTRSDFAASRRALPSPTALL